MQFTIVRLNWNSLTALLKQIFTFTKPLKKQEQKKPECQFPVSINDCKKQS